MHAQIDGGLDGVAAFGCGGEAPLSEARQQQAVERRVSCRLNQAHIAMAVRVHDEACQCNGRERLFARFVRDIWQRLVDRPCSAAPCLVVGIRRR